MTQANFDAFNTAGGDLLATWHGEDGYHVAFVIPEPTTIILSLLGTCVGCLVARRRLLAQQ